MNCLSHNMKRFLVNNASNILTGISCLGVIATGVLSVKATPKALKMIEEEQKVRSRESLDYEELSKWDVVKIVWKCYIPAVTMGVGTIACICSSNYLSLRKQATLMNSYAILQQSFKEYRSKLIELHGEEADKEIRESIVRGHCDYHRIGIEEPDEKMLILEPISGQLFSMYERELMDAEYHINRNFILRGAVTLNELYQFLGLPETELGEKIGWWVCDGYMWIDFEHNLGKTKDGRDCYVLESVFPPDENYEDGLWE